MPARLRAKKILQGGARFPPHIRGFHRATLMRENFTVEFYETETGDSPAYEFIKSQEVKMRAKIYRTLELLKEHGNNLRMPYSEHLDEGIFQVRTQVGNNITRVLYFFVVEKKIILTNGFAKKTQETPPAEIELAKKYRADYLNRRVRQ